MTKNPKKYNKQPVHPLDDLIRTDRIPHIWCSGCGIGTVFSSCLKAIKATEIPYNRFTMVSGIGCSARGAGYVNLDSFHTTHGRAIPFATGLKLAKPGIKVFVLSGDGDISAIGGNHLIHAARRNIDISVICVNNSVYGMTGGQAAPTTQLGDITSTTPYGNVEPPFNLVSLAAASGATYVARWPGYDTIRLQKSLRKTLQRS
jgi:2-oxoglutarate ferredoxin oxidoreductase subunit beta